MPDGSSGRAPLAVRSRSFSQRHRRLDAALAPPSPFAAPRTSSMVPSVTMNGHDAELRDQDAVERRRTARRRRPRRSAATSGLRAASRSSSAMTTVLSATIDPTDRSMPPDDDHHRHAERGDADDRRLPRHQLEIGGAEELRADQRAEDRARRGRGRAGRPRASSSRRAVMTRPARGRRVHHQRVFCPCSDRRAAAEPSARHHRDPIAHAEQLGQVAADHQHGLRRSPGRRRRARR